MTLASDGPLESRQAFDRLLAELRPRLHRYCARMAGSVVDGEDVVQDALVKAIEAFADGEPIRAPESWLFRVAHNSAVDFLRSRARANSALTHEGLDTIVDPAAAADRHDATTASLRTFMRLPVTERSAVILMDVFGYSLDEIAGITDLTIPAVKASLHRGRARLRGLAHEFEDAASPRMAEPEGSRLASYIERFNARDFDAVRTMLADDVKLELVSRARLNGAQEVGRYFHNYSVHDDWRMVAGSVDGRPAALVLDPRQPSEGWKYFVILEWRGDRLISLRDFRHAAYVIESAELPPLDS
jgi:RNA polymerase sigma-70 factor, ECF subfamily